MIHSEENSWWAFTGATLKTTADGVQTVCVCVIIINLRANSMSLQKCSMCSSVSSSLSDLLTLLFSFIVSASTITFFFFLFTNSRFCPKLIIHHEGTVNPSVLYCFEVKQLFLKRTINWTHALEVEYRVYKSADSLRSQGLCPRQSVVKFRLQRKERLWFWWFQSQVTADFLWSAASA